MSSPLEQLYPGLRRAEASEPAPGPRTDELMEAIRSKAADSIETKRAFFEAQALALLEMARALADCFRRGGRLLTMGNGGSASDAAHVAVEFNHPVTAGRPALPAYHLGADLTFTTAIGNDVGFDQIFSRQVIAWGRKGDGLLGLSTSGNSKNLLAAFRTAKERGLLTLAFLGGDGGRASASEFVDHRLVVSTSSIHRIQECHVAAYHVLWDLVHTLLASDRTGRQGEQGA